MTVATTALDVRALAAAAHGRVVSGDAGRVCTQVSIDSRTIANGAMFVAVRGPRYDGHDFVAGAVARGAAALVLESATALGTTPTGDVPVVLVDDTVRALQDMAHAVRSASGARVVAITGSAGKTTTKEAVATILEPRYRTLRNRGNLNNHLGLPMSLFDLQAGWDVAVVELGMNHAGEIRRLVEIAEPDVRVWTNVGTAHIGYFGSMEAIAEAKAEIMEGATAGSVLVANADDPRVMRHAQRFAGRVVTFGTSHDADVAAMAIEERGVAGVSIDVRTPRGSLTIASPLIGRANVSNLLAAVAVGVELDIALTAIPPRLGNLGPSEHRGEVLRLAGDVVVVDDCYNASPSAVERMLQACGHGTHRRFVAWLGEMLELGDQSASLHADVGRAAREAGVHQLVTVGGDAARVMADAAVDAGLRPGSVLHVSDSDAAAALASHVVRDGDLVLVKGSRGIHMERVIERLQQERG